MTPDIDFYLLKPISEELQLENELKDSLSENKKAYLGCIDINGTKIHGYLVPNREKLGFASFYMPTEHKSSTYNSIILSVSELDSMIEKNKPLHHQILGALNKRYSQIVGEFIFIGYSGLSYEKGIKITRILAKEAKENESGMSAVKDIPRERLAAGFLLDLQKQTEIVIRFGKI